MIYLYDQALVKHLGKYFSNVICGDESEDVGADTKRLSFKEKTLSMPYIAVKREVEYNRVSDYGGTSANPLFKAPIKMASTFLYNKDDRKKAIKNDLINENSGYNYSIMPLPIDLRYTLKLVGDNKENIDDTFSDLIFILLTDRVLNIKDILSNKITTEDFYTYIEIDSASYEGDFDKQSGARFSYTLNLVITGAKIYFTEKRKVVLRAPVLALGEKKGG